MHGRGSPQLFPGISQAQRLPVVEDNIAGTWSRLGIKSKGVFQLYLVEPCLAAVLTDIGNQ